MKRDFVQLADTYSSEKHGIGGWFLSEKLDGQRAIWDGGVTRGHYFQNVPWSNMAKDKRNHVCTGLWSRYGKPIFAPDWFLDRLPPIVLDGELYAKDYRQILRGIISKLVPDDNDWSRVGYHVFDAPTYEQWLEPGRINSPNFPEKQITAASLDYAKLTAKRIEKKRSFADTVEFLKNQDFWSNQIVLHEQERLPFSTSSAIEVLTDRMAAILDNGGEGVILRKPESYWTPRRVSSLLKHKDVRDDEGIVIGYEWAEEGKLHGMMGALILRWREKEIRISGFTDNERLMSVSGKSEKPGSRVSMGIENPSFPLGTVVTFKYQDLSKDGMPNHARYWRKRDDQS